MGSICELSDVGELGLTLLIGGGVVDRARGLLCADAAGEEPGDDGSTAGRLSPNRHRIFSSSDGVLISTSRRSDERKEGASSLCPGDLAVGAAATGAPFLLILEGAWEADSPADEALLGAPIRLVRGRLRRRSGSGAGSAGEAVTERDLRFLLGLAASDSLALSRAPQALLSSLVSSAGGWGGCLAWLTC